MDPVTVLGAAASVLQLAQAAITLSATLYAVGRALQSAREDIENLANDLKTFSSNLAILHRLLNDSKGLYTDDVYLLTSQIIQDCATLYGKIIALLAKLGSTEKSRLKASVKFVLKDGEFKKLLERMRDLKITLQNILVSLQLDLTINFILKDKVLQRQDDTALNPATIKALEQAQSAAEDVAPLTKAAEEISKSFQESPEDDEAIDSFQLREVNESPALRRKISAEPAAGVSQTSDPSAPMMAAIRIMAPIRPAPDVSLIAISSAPAVTSASDEQHGDDKPGEPKDNASISSFESFESLLIKSRNSAQLMDYNRAVGPQIIRKIVALFKIGRMLAGQLEETQGHVLLSGAIKQDRHRITLRHAAKALAVVMREAAEEIESQFEFGSELLGEPYIKAVEGLQDQCSAIYELNKTKSSIRETVIRPLRDYSSGKRKCEASTLMTLIEGTKTLRNTCIKLLDPLSGEWDTNHSPSGGNPGPASQSLELIGSHIEAPEVDELVALQDQIQQLANKISGAKLQLFDLENPSNRLVASSVETEGTAAASLANLTSDPTKSGKGRWKLWKGRKTNPDPDISNAKPKLSSRNREKCVALRMDIQIMESQRQRLVYDFDRLRIRAVIPQSEPKVVLFRGSSSIASSSYAGSAASSPAYSPQAPVMWSFMNSELSSPSMTQPTSAAQFMDINSEVYSDSDSFNLATSNERIYPDVYSGAQMHGVSSRRVTQQGRWSRLEKIKGGWIAFNSTIREARVTNELAHGQLSSSTTIQGPERTAAEAALLALKIQPDFNDYARYHERMRAKISRSNRNASSGYLTHRLESLEREDSNISNHFLHLGLDTEFNETQHRRSASLYSDSSSQMRRFLLEAEPGLLGTIKPNSWGARVLSQDIYIQSPHPTASPSVNIRHTDFVAVRPSHKFNSIGNNHGMWAEVELSLRAEDQESLEKFDKFLDRPLLGSSKWEAIPNPLASSILKVIEALDEAIGLEGAVKIWAAVMRLLEASKSPKVTVSRVEMFLRDLKSIVTVIARYAVMENLFHQWEGASIQNSYRTALLKLGTLVLRFLVRAVLMWDGIETYDGELLAQFAAAAVDADMACRKFSFVPEPMNGNDGETGQPKDNDDEAVKINAEA